MKKITKAIIIFLTIILISALGYIGYGSTMINIESEKSIINHLSADKDQPINIFAAKKYQNHFFIVYSDPTETEKNATSSRFSCFTKHKFYKNRYKYKGGTTGKQSEVMVSGIEIDKNYEDDTVTYAIGNVASNETKCSVFEVNSETGIALNRIDVIDVPLGEAYIIVKNYQLSSSDNMLVVYDGVVELSLLTGE